MSLAETPAAKKALAARVGAYAFGSVGTGVFSTVPTVLLLYFCTEVLSLPASWATLIVLAPKLWAILWDPIVGSWSDATRTRFGRRAPFLLAGALFVSSAFLALFSPPELLGGASLAVWTGVAYFALATAYSVFAVPYIALPAEISIHSHERAAFVSARMVLAMIGVLLGAGAAPLIAQAYGGGRQGYAAMAVVVCVICFGAMLAPIYVARQADIRTMGPPARLWGGLRDALSHRRFALTSLAYLLQLTAVGVLSAAAPYLVTALLVRPEGDIGTALGVMLLVTAACVPLWTKLGLKIGDRKALFWAAGVYAGLCVVLAALVAAAAPWPFVVAAFALAGAPFAGVQVLPFTLLAHLIHEETAATGNAAEGMFTGVWTAAEKLGLAFGPALVGLTLWLGGGRASALPLLLAAGPAFLMALSLALMRLIPSSKPIPS